MSRKICCSLLEEPLSCLVSEQTVFPVNMFTFFFYILKQISDLNLLYLAFTFILGTNCDIDLIQKWLTFSYSFACIQISLTSLVKGKILFSF